MKKLVLGLLFASIAGTAYAADMPVRSAPYTKAPLVDPMTNWSGFYIGAMGGYASEATSDPLAVRGGFGGGTVGYNWQSGAFVAGIEADAAWANINRTAAIVGIGSVTDRVQSLGTVRGRVGAAFGQALFYATGGFAWADNKVDINVLGLNFSDSQVHTGWVGGAGVEWMFTRGWSVKAEYLYRSFGGKTYFANQFPPGVATGSLAMHSGQVGINYHF